MPNIFIAMVLNVIKCGTCYKKKEAYDFCRRIIYQLFTNIFYQNYLFIQQSIMQIKVILLYRRSDITDVILHLFVILKGSREIMQRALKRSSPKFKNLSYRWSIDLCTIGEIIDHLFDIVYNRDEILWHLMKYIAITQSIFSHINKVKEKKKCIKKCSLSLARRWRRLYLTKVSPKVPTSRRTTRRS